MKTVYQIRVEGPRKGLDSRGHFYSKRVFVSLDQAKAFALGFEERCCGNGLWDLERVTDTKFVELELDEEAGCPWTTGGDEHGIGAVRCGRPITHRCTNAPDTCERHKSSCCVPKHVSKSEG